MYPFKDIQVNHWLETIVDLELLGIALQIQSPLKSGEDLSLTSIDFNDVPKPTVC